MRYFYKVDEEMVKDKRVSYFSCILFGLFIPYQTKYKKCFASNTFLSGKLGVSESTISKSITELVDAKYITRELEYYEGTKQVRRRIVKVINVKQYLGGEESPTGSDESPIPPIVNKEIGSDNGNTPIGDKEIGGEDDAKLTDTGDSKGLKDTTNKTCDRKSPEKIYSGDNVDELDEDDLPF